MAPSMSDYRSSLERLSRVLDRRLFFIVGLTRPGTVWLQHAVNAHPQAVCRGEGHFTNVLFPYLGRAFADYNKRMVLKGTRLRDASPGDGLSSAVYPYSNDDVRLLLACAAALTLDKVAEDADVTCIGEKTPEQVMNLKTLNEVFPDAKMIHVIRDGRDEAVSVHDFNLRTRTPGFVEKFPDFSLFAEHFARNWNRAVGAAHAFGRSHAGDYLEIRCEDLHREASPDVERLFRFLGIDDGPEAVSLAVEQGRRAAFPDGVIGQWRERFDDKARTLFNRHAGELLRLLDYPT